MSVFSLTFVPSEDEWTSGVPKTVEIESSVPATIYYTTNGTIPNLDSFIYVGAISVPEGTESFILQAFGVDFSSNVSPILSYTFSANETQLASSRLIDGDGVVVDSFADQTNTVAGFNASGVPGTFIDVTEQFVFDNSIHSDRGVEGTRPGTLIKVNVPNPQDTPNFNDNNFQAESTTQYAATFNPFAKTISIDNRLQNEVQTVMRPWGSLENIYRETYGTRIIGSADDSCYISGGFVRKFYDRNKGIMTSYYFDHNEARWIRNTSEIPSNITPTMGIYANPQNTHVYLWIARWGNRQTSNMV